MKFRIGLPIGFFILIFIISGKYVFAQQWTQCVDLTGKTCNQICAQQWMTCGKCTTSRGYDGWGAEAWPAGYNCQGPGAGQTHCDFVGDSDPAGGIGARWKCCCQATDNFRSRPVCHDSDDASGGVAEGGIKPHPGRLFYKEENTPYIFTLEDGQKRGCGPIYCRPGAPWDQYYNNSGVYTEEKGRTWGNDADGKSFEQEDYCKDENTLIEFFCKNFYENTLLGSKSIECSGGCREGRCVGGERKKASIENPDQF